MEKLKLTHLRNLDGSEINLDKVNENYEKFKTNYNSVISSMPTYDHIIQVANEDRWEEFARAKDKKVANMIRDWLVENNYTVRINRVVQDIELGQIKELNMN